MSGRDDYYQPPPGNPHQPLQSNNPFQQSAAEQNAWQSQPSTSPQQQQYGQSGQNYVPPPGPPPQQNVWQDAPPSLQQSQPQLQYAPAPDLPQRNQPQSGPLNDHFAPPRKSPTFKESDFVPTEERGEQREAFEQFEMSKGGESTEDREIAMLQREFPGVDGSLVAALYGDAGGVRGTREMLRELGGGGGAS